MDDHLQRVIAQFNSKRKRQPMNGRFPNYLRAVVVETNDPLNMGRVRFRCPELHDKDIPVKFCPWAEPAKNHVGGQNGGDWSPPIIGHYIFITFEKADPRVPLYVSAADPTLRRNYPLESVHTRTPGYLDADGSVAEGDNPPDDFDRDYLPKDQRPMSRGWKDPYGNLIGLYGTGFVPSSHRIPPAPAGMDPTTSAELSAGSKPKVNEPDYKTMTMITKLGHQVVVSDIGYEWDSTVKDDKETVADDNQEVEVEVGDGDEPADAEIKASKTRGEFTGDFEADKDFEVKRWKYLQKLISEGESKDSDQRRYSIRTRAGHYFEMRDVGWNKTRAGEFTDESRIISDTDKDERWIKMATKGGHLLQLMDVGFDPENDNNYKGDLLDDVGEWHEEDEWGADKRQIRLVSRHGFKLAIDDRGSSDTSGEDESPHGNGILLKTRRGSSKAQDDMQTIATQNGGGGGGRGHYLELSDKDEVNAIKLGTPNDQLIEINDKYKFISINTEVPHEVNREWKGLKDNEFTLSSARMNQAAELETFHLILDKENEFGRFKTPKAQGLEMRDKEELVDLRDEEDRGLFLSKSRGFSVFRSMENRNSFLLIDDNNKVVLLQNNDGKIQVYSNEAIELVSDTEINMKAPKINLRARDEINITASGISGKVANGKLGVTGDVHADNVRAFIPEGERPLHIDGKGIAKPEPIAGNTPNITKDERERSDLSPKQDTEELGLAPNMPKKPVDESVIRGE